METKFTKGKWAWQKFGDKYCLVAQHGMREVILSSNINEEKSLQPYLTMNKDGILKPIDPNHPNAKLIAAAPDLLNACQLVMKSSRGETLSFQTLTALYDAIEKATN